MEFQYGTPVNPPQRRKPKEPDFLPVCLACGYDMRGDVSHRCPECGQTFSHSQWEREVRHIKYRIDEVEGYLRWVPWSWKVGLAGVLLRLLGLTAFGGGGFFIRVLAAICGVASVLMAVNVLRTRQIPTWARGRVKVKPDSFGASLGIGFGLAAIASAVLLR